jgi:hypothetical protein
MTNTITFHDHGRFPFLCLLPFASNALRLLSLLTSDLRPLTSDLWFCALALALCAFRLLHPAPCALLHAPCSLLSYTLPPCSLLHSGFRLTPHALHLTIKSLCLVATSFGISEAAQWEAAEDDALELVPNDV